MYTEFVSPNITLEIVQQQLSNLYAAPGAGNVSIENIQKVVADAYNIKVEELKGKRRDKYNDPQFLEGRQPNEFEKTISILKNNFYKEEYLK